MNTIKIVVLGVIKKNNKYLLTKRVDEGRSHAKWQIPGGGLEFGEHPLDTLHREMKEELGINVTVIRQSDKIFSRVEDTWQGIFISFLCTANSENFVLNEEASEYGWFTLDEATKLKDRYWDITDVIEAFTLH